MNKEQFMELVSEAWDTGAFIRIQFCQMDKINGQYHPSSEKIAINRIKLAESALDAKAEYRDDTHPSNINGVGSYNVSFENISVDASFHIKEELKYA